MAKARLVENTGGFEMEYIIGGLIFILILYITGYLLKKKHYKEMDRLEAWKIEVMNSPVLDELSKVKKLNMTGQTEQLFEQWRKDWDDIVTNSLPDIEEYLFDAEEYIDKYRFNRAKNIQKTIEEHLSKTEEKITALINEINNLVGSEEKNRTEIEELKELYRLSKKTLLAHRHNYGLAEKALELKLDEVILSFQQFDELTSSGNYLDAKEAVISIHSKLEDINDKLEIIPNLLVECQSRIPSQLDEIKEGFREMSQQGYILDHVQLDKEVERIENELTAYKHLLEKTETEDVVKGIEDIKDSIELLYDLLEEEVKAKQFIMENENLTKDMLQTTQLKNEALKSEIESVKQSYHLTDTKLEHQVQLEKLLMQMLKRFELLEHKIEQDETAYSLLRDELTDIRSQLETMNSELATFTEDLHMLRKDEIAAREKVQELTRKMVESIKLVSKNNIPGIPDGLLNRMDEAKLSIQDVKGKLEAKPLDIPSVQNVLEIAVVNVEKTYDTVIELVETVMLVEKVIQYGNRYRSRYSSVEKGLKEAELSFRGFDYEAALEQAATTIEAVEPGALKRIEALLAEQIS